MNKKQLFYWAGTLQLLVGIGAVVSGIILILDPDGSNLSLSVAILKDSPFEDFLIPGITLLIINGIGSILGSFFSFKRRLFAGQITMILGTAMVIWISAQVYWINWISWLQPVYLIVGIFEIILGFVLYKNINSLKTFPL
ncbi:hypothetical protein J7E81_04610 [Bacillus sp. ISL-18]|uniref:hypothetical protein n=1 Tax=Bacillus sp. ISL-18 TaxID=2819118 RepID=UPI001BEA06F3|nr:hypothetical protein [Bacillus sp. ISL-18]MBT2654526.1 hypothetical protein [Bacillus sp. ISL-18]